MSTTESEHEWFNEQIATYLADGLDAEERARFDGHAQGCAECAAELANARELESRMSSAFSGMIPADFEERLLGRLSSTLNRVEGRFSSPTRRFWVHPLVRKSAIAAAAAIVVSGFGYAGNEYMKRKDSSTIGFLEYLSPVKTARRAAMNPAASQTADEKLDFGGGVSTHWNVAPPPPAQTPAQARIPDTFFNLDNLTMDDTAQAVGGAKEFGFVRGNYTQQNLNIGTFVGRVPNSASALTTMPMAGGLNTNEIVHVGSFDPSVDPASPAFRKGLPAYIAAQTSGTNTGADFLTKDGGRNLTQVTYSGTQTLNAGSFMGGRGGAGLGKATMDMNKAGAGFPGYTRPGDLSSLTFGGESLDPKRIVADSSAPGGSTQLDGSKQYLATYKPYDAGNQLTMGGGTVSSGTVTSTVNLAGGTLAPLNATPGTGQTLATVNGNLDLGQGPATFNLGREVALLQEAPSSPRNGNATTQSTSGTSAPQLSIRKVIREGVMEFEVDSFDSTFIQLSKIAAEEGGFVAAADSDKLPNGKVKGSVTVRVPPDHLDTLVLKLRALGELKTQRLGSRDVGKEYTDLEGQLRAARAMEERLLEMIKNANGKVADLLQAERELGTWRTKIETLTGQLNYYNNLISMATLTVNAYEKDIRTPASASQTEEINTGIETDDVESARAAAIKSIDDVKGRIVESTLQKLEAGQFAARIVAEVAPENAGQLVDRLKQLGRVARLDIQRRQTTTSGTVGAVAPVRIEPAPTKLIISMYNLANVAPRLTTNLNLAGDNVESIYRAILKRVGDAGGRVVVSNLNRQDATNVTGSMQFEVKSADADAVLNDIRKDVQVLRLSVNENPDTANVTTAKQAFTVQVIPTAQVPPRQTRTLHVQISDVETGMQSINAALAGVGARLGDSNLMQDAEGRSVARLGIDVPLGKVDQLLDVARKLGKVRVSESSENPQVPEGPLARARINLELRSGETIIPAQGGFWSSIREGLSTSVKGLMWSLELIVIGLCLVGPWVGLLWGGWRMFRKARRHQGT